MAGTITNRYIPTQKLIDLLRDLPADTAVCQSAHSHNFAILEFDAERNFRSMGYIDLRREETEIFPEDERFAWRRHRDGEI